MSDDDEPGEVCWQCAPDLAHDDERVPGWCARCGFFFDLHGMRIPEPWRTCRVHKQLRASCPHSGSLRGDHH